MGVGRCQNILFIKRKINIVKVGFILHFLILSFKLSLTSCTLIYYHLCLDLRFDLSCVPSSKVSLRLPVCNVIECFCLVSVASTISNGKSSPIFVLKEIKLTSYHLVSAISEGWVNLTDRKSQVREVQCYFPVCTLQWGAGWEHNLGFCTVRHS